MAKKNLATMVNEAIASFDRIPKSIYKRIVDLDGMIITFHTRQEWLEYLGTRERVKY
jgi:hypothetical protein